MKSLLDNCQHLIYQQWPLPPKSMFFCLRDWLLDLMHFSWLNTCNCPSWGQCSIIAWVKPTANCSQLIFRGRRIYSTLLHMGISPSFLRTLFQPALLGLEDFPTPLPQMQYSLFFTNLHAQLSLSKTTVWSSSLLIWPTSRQNNGQRKKPPIRLLYSPWWVNSYEWALFL